MEHKLLELARQIFGRSGQVSDDVRTSLAELPAGDRAAVLAFGNRLALAGPGTGSLPRPTSLDPWQ